MAKRKLTKEVVRTAACAPGRKELTLWDEGKLGFGLRIYATGKKSFVFRRRLPTTGKPITVKYPGEASPSTFKDARDRWADETAIQITKGINPNVQRQQLREAASREAAAAKSKKLTIGQVFDEYLREKRTRNGRPLRPTTRSLLTTVRKQLEAQMGADKAFATITKAELENVRRSVNDKIGVAPADRVVRGLRAVWNWARDHEPMGLDLGENPARGMGQYGTGSRERQLEVVIDDEQGIYINQLQPFWSALESTGNPRNIAYVKTLLLTGARRREISELRWPEIDFDLGRITLTPARTKTDRTYIFYLCRELQQILRDLRDMREEGPFVFPSHTRAFDPETGTRIVQPLQEPKTIFAAVADLCGIHVTPHDLRRTYVRQAQEAGVPLVAVSRLINHAAPPGQTAEYDNYTPANLTRFAEKAGRHIVALATETKVAQLHAVS